MGNSNSQGENKDKNPSSGQKQTPTSQRPTQQPTQTVQPSKKFDDDEMLNTAQQKEKERGTPKKEEIQKPDEKVNTPQKKEQEAPLKKVEEERQVKPQEIKVEPEEEEAEGNFDDFLDAFDGSDAHAVKLPPKKEETQVKKVEPEIKKESEVKESKPEEIKEEPKEVEKTNENDEEEEAEGNFDDFLEAFDGSDAHAVKIPPKVQTKTETVPKVEEVKPEPKEEEKANENDEEEEEGNFDDFLEAFDGSDAHAVKLPPKKAPEAKENEITEEQVRQKQIEVLSKVESLLQQVEETEAKLFGVQPTEATTPKEPEQDVDVAQLAQEVSKKQEALINTLESMVSRVDKLLEISIESTTSTTSEDVEIKKLEEEVKQKQEKLLSDLEALEKRIDSLLPQDNLQERVKTKQEQLLATLESLEKRVDQLLEATSNDSKPQSSEPTEEEVRQKQDKILQNLETLEKRVDSLLQVAAGNDVQPDPKEIERVKSLQENVLQQLETLEARLAKIESGDVAGPKVAQQESIDASKSSSIKQDSLTLYYTTLAKANN